MSVFQKIEKLLNINNMNLTTLSKRSGVPVSTLFSLKNRDSKRTSIETLKKIADAFGVNINYFAGDISGDAINITQEEEDLLLKIRALDQHGLKVVNSIIDMEFERVDATADINVKLCVNGEIFSKETTVDINELEKIVEELK